jgi:sugar (pentulose or hexulose) kinase
MMGGGSYIIAIDLGASGSKMAAVRLKKNTVKLLEIYNFPNAALQLGPSLYWDIFALYKNIIKGFSYFASKYGEPLSVGIDTWGTTYGFLDQQGRLVEPVYHYRDKRTDGVLAELYKQVSRREIFDLTGSQCAYSYTLVQFYASLLHKDAVLNYAKHFLMLPDLLAYFLGGDISVERTISGTSSMMEPSQKTWCYALLDRLHISSGFLPEVISTGSIRGKLVHHLADETGLGSPLIVAAIGHDTAAAIAAIPGFTKNDMFISIGTQIIIGTCNDNPVLTEECYLGGFKNAASGDGKMLIYQDFPAAWMLNRLHDEWNKKGTVLSYDDLDAAAANTAKGMLFNIEDVSIQKADGEISRVITALIEKTGQPKPEAKGEFVRSVMESIALRVRYYALTLLRVRKSEFRHIRIISGGIRYKTLVSLISSALERPVDAGLPFATVTGNAVSQFCALGQLDTAGYGINTNNVNFFTEAVPASSRNWQEDLEWSIQNKIF